MPGPYSAGSVLLQVIPSFEGVQDEIRRFGKKAGKAYGEGFDEDAKPEIKKGLEQAVEEGAKAATKKAADAGAKAGKEYSKGFSREAGKETSKELVRAMERAGEQAGERSARRAAGKFATTLRQQAKAMSQQVNAIKIGVDDKELLKDFDRIQAIVRKLGEGKIGVHFDAAEAAAAMAALEQILDRMSKEAVELRTKVDLDQAARDARAFRKMVETAVGDKPVEVPVKVDERQLGAFERNIKEALAGALRAMPPLDLDTHPASEAVERIRASIQALSDKKIGVDITGEQALREIALIQAAVQELARQRVDIQTKFDLTTLLGQLDTAQKRVNDLDGSKADIELRVTDVKVPEPERLIGSFERTFRKSIENALRNLPPLDIDVNDAALAAEVDAVRRELTKLQDAKLGVDLSSDEALAKLRELLSRLSELDGKTADVQVRSDVAETARELGAVFALVKKIEDADAKVAVSASGAATTAAQLRQVNKEAKNTSSNGMDAANAFRAFNGRMFAFLALAPAAVPLLGALAGGLAAIGPAALAGIAGIGVGALGFSGIGGAVKALGDVQNNATKDSVSRARTMRSAARGVRDAEQNLARARVDGAQAVEDAGRRVEDALRSQERAEEQLSDAQEASRRAQQDLIDARDEGARQLEDLSLRARGGALAERQAALDLAKAQADYILTMQDGASTNVEREQVAIALEREKLGYEQARLENKRLQEQQADAAKTGVEGTEAYQQALGKVVGANRDVEDAQRGVADASRGVADANRGYARAQVESQQRVADAVQSLADAQEDYRTALQQTDEVGTSSMSNLEKAMRDLGPAGQDFARFLYGLKPFFLDMRREAQEGFLPGLQSWMTTLTTHYGPQLLSTIRGLSGALGDVFSGFGTALEGDAFQQLFDMLENDGPRWIRDMGTGVTDLGTGFAYLLVAARPFTDLFLGAFKELSRDFRDWAAQVKGSQGFKDFFGYVQRIAPEVGEFLKELGRALMNLLEAVAPYGETVLNLLTGFLRWVGDMDPAALGVIATSIFTLGTAMQSVFALTSLMKSAEAAWHLATGRLGQLGAKAPLVAGGLLALLGGMVILYTQSEDFRAVIDKLVGAFADLTGAVGGAVGPIGLVTIAIAGWAVFRNAGGWLGSLTQSSGRLSGALGVLKSAASGIGALLAIVGTAYAIGASKIDSWSEALLDGGRAAATAVGEMNRQFQNTSVIGAFWDNTKLFFADMTAMFQGYADAQDAATQKASAAYAAMDPLARAQQNVKTATADLTLAQEEYGPKSDEAALASGRLEEAQRRLTKKQEDVEDATRDATDALADQAVQLLAAEDSNIAFEQAQLAVAEASQRYNEALASDDPAVRKQAELELRSAYQQVAAAAARQAEDQAKLRGETLTATESAAAQLAAMQRLRDEMGINLPPELANLILGLEATAGAADNVARAADGVTGSVQAIPGTKDVFINGLTQDAKDKLAALDITVTEFPDGHFELHAKTDQAQTDLDAFLKQAQQNKILIGVELLDAIWHGQGGTPVIPGRGPGEYLPGFPMIPGGPNRADGGPIEGPGTETSDSVPILASDGEYMIRASSVRKYGRSFFDLINAGQYAIGGLISRTLPRFADGGPVRIPTWRGTVQAGDTTPLARAWGETLDGLGAMTGDAAPLLAAMWTALRDAALGSVGQLRDGTTGEFSGMLHDLDATTGRLRDSTLATVEQTRVGTLRTWGDLTGRVTGSTDQALGETERRFRDMQSTVGQVASGTRDNVGTIFGTYRSLTADPVNFVITDVLNKGLFAALNSVSSTYGLNRTIPPAAPVQLPRLAVGGPVPGSSPSKTADNIPAWLTAGEFVHPVDTVQYYGADFMEALRQRKIPRFADGGLVSTWRQLDELRRRLFPGSVLTSALRNTKDYHGAGMAIDIGVPGNDPAKLVPIARQLAQLYPQSSELINNPGGSIKNGRPVPPSFWGPATWADHADHVHWAMTAAALAMGALGTGGGGFGSADDVRGSILDSVTGPISKLFAQFGGSRFTGLLGDAVKVLPAEAWNTIAGTVNSAFDFTGDAVPVGGGPVRDVVQRAAAQRGWGSGAQWAALDWIIGKESGWNPTAQNPRSTASGLFQHIDATWRGSRPAAAAGFAKMRLAPPELQAIAGMNYFASRYGDPLAAQAFWRAHGHYADGGPVEPTLYDAGGYLPPGLSMVLNGTGRPEPVLTADELELMREGAGSRELAPVIGSLTLPMVAADPREAVDEINHWATHYRSGGRYDDLGD